ncbi:7-cyano-7-deazaguanine synthase [Frigoriglobus tundricola]|uniref:7-cyano-7-deazaguanine synthase n=1 Tax=Frigoriglobus tundricola TaxID=2774151 RepID=A0A6M5YTX3_9BACT|nr:7-cyano-7-deazaguanine synthase [Frigoriglobus tundricola]QJW96701.1 Queuosine Biosynthesis QueC ATPase [Frigoriglobus tundricola]
MLNTPAPAWPPPAPSRPLAVLVSGGLDSAVLLAEAARAYPLVFPLYVRTGLHWEEVERAYLDRFLVAVRAPGLRPLVVLDQPVADVYGTHWSVSGEGVPGADTPDEAVFLPGRNVLLLAKPLIWCHLNGVPEVATAPLGSNPFPDATQAFYDGFARIVSSAIGGSVSVLRPYSALHKLDVLRRGRGLPLEYTFSCIRPAAGGVHCGACNKCAERRAGFRDAGTDDPTRYASDERSA